jgi:tRNA-specific 2-thiouridylase
VFAEFLREYQAGRTPNPDVLCNAEIKFKAFLDHAMRLGAEHIATGHYARVRLVDHDGRVVDDHARLQARVGDGEFQLLKGDDPAKDQSYFLHRLNQAQLARALFPLGHLRKTEVRKLAAEIGLPNAKKKDSTGICFIGERPFREFLNRYLPTTPGPIRADDGTRVGQHIGLAFYTLGQRKGIGVGGRKSGNGEPWFVARKDMASNTLWIVQGHEHPWLMSQRLVAESASWVSGTPPAAGAQLSAKTRYRQANEPCTVLRVDGEVLELEFDRPQWAVTPGQSVVLYLGAQCLGGAVISS